MKRAWFADVAAFTLLLVTIAFFFLPLFYPEPQLIVTPDFGRSDAWHFSFATKYALSQSLRQGNLPLWVPEMGRGFPLLAEGQVGALFLPNLVLFSLFNPTSAYNLALALAVTMLGVSMYWWMRLLPLSPLPALLAGLTLAFSGISILQLPHISLLQGLSLFPAAAAATILLARQGSWRRVALLSLILAQQLLAGFPQASFITVLFSLGYFIFLGGRNKNRWSLLGQFILAGILALGLSAIQLLPSLEFLRLIVSPTATTPDGATSFSFPIKHLLTFFNPFALGNPQSGTYPPFWEFDGSIFWENTGYIGLIPLLLAAWVVVGRQRSSVIFFISVLIGSFLLMSGKYSPLYFIHSFWPFSLFRVPSRFIWLFTVSLIVLAALGLERVLKSAGKKWWLTALIVSLITGNTITLWLTWRGYHALAPARLWLTPPAVVSSLLPGRLLTIGNSQVHNRFFLLDGWKDIAPYFSLRETLAANSNLLWHVPQIGVYAGRQLRRGSILDSLLSQGIAVGEKQATVSAQAVKFMSLLSVRNIISALPIDQENLTLKGKINDDPLLPLTLLENPAALARAYVVHTATMAATLKEAITTLKSDQFILGETVLLEEVNPNDSVRQLASTKILKGKPPAEVEITEDEPSTVTIDVRQNPTPGFLILTDMWYPGWQATVDGTTTPIFPANLAQRAVFIPDGNHTIKFQYEPPSVALGSKISVTSLVVTAFLAGSPLLGVVFRIRQKARPLAAHPRRSRAKSGPHKG